MILEQLLKRLASGRVQSLAELAKGLDVDQDLLLQMIADLERAGYVEPVEVACGTACESCPRTGLCQIVHEGRIWSVTEKGMRVAQEL